VLKGHHKWLAKEIVDLGVGPAAFRTSFAANYDQSEANALPPALKKQIKIIDRSPS